MYLLLLVCLAFCYAGAVALYRLFLHPLHIYPGPVFAAVTDWYEAYYNIIQKGGLLTEIEKLHKLHGKLIDSRSSALCTSLTSVVTGPVVRVGPNTVKRLSMRLGIVL